MNKLFTKIGAAMVVIAMAVGVGVAVGRDGAKEVRASDPITYTFSTYDGGTQYAENESHTLDSVVTVITNQAHFTSEIRLYNNGANSGAVTDNFILVKSLKPITSISANINCNTSSQTTTLTITGSNNSGSTYSSVGTMTTPSGKTYGDKSISSFGTDVSYSWLKIVNTGSYQCRIKTMTLTFKEVESVVESVTVKGPDNETGSMTVNSGVLGHKTVQLVSDVVYSTGQGDESVVWSSSSENNTVSQTGLVNITANENTVITVRSAEDNTVDPATITLNISGLQEIDFVTKEIEVNSTNFGNSDKKATTSNTSVTLTNNNISFTITRNTCTSDAGYHVSSNPVSFRIYTNAQLTVSTVDGGLMHYVSLLSINATYPLSSAAASLSTGTFTVDKDGNAKIDLSANPVNSFTINASAQFRFDLVKVYYLETDKVIVTRFVDENMHLDDIPVSEASRQSSGETCKAYYVAAKEALTALTAEQIALFKSDDDFNDAQERYESWAEIYGDTTPYSKDITPKAGVVGVANSNNNSVTAIVIIAAVVTTLTVAGVFLLRKKEEK